MTDAEICSSSNYDSKSFPVRDEALTVIYETCCQDYPISHTSANSLAKEFSGALAITGHSMLSTGRGDVELDLVRMYRLDALVYRRGHQPYFRETLAFLLLTADASVCLASG